MTKRGSPGRDSVSDSLAFEKHVSNIGARVMRLEHLFEGAWENGFRIVRLSVRMPTVDKSDYLITVVAQTAEGQQVGFVGGDTLATALVALAGQLQAGSLKWREDQYAR